MPKLDRLLETALYVDDMRMAADFYERVMGLAPILETETLRAYDAGSATVLLLFKRGGSLKTQEMHGGTIPPHDGAGPVHVCFAVQRDTLTEWEAHFTGASIPIEGRVDWPRGGTSIYFRDPDGHLLELATPGLWPTY